MRSTPVASEPRNAPKPGSRVGPGSGTDSVGDESDQTRTDDAIAIAAAVTAATVHLVLIDDGS